MRSRFDVAAGWVALQGVAAPALRAALAGAVLATASMPLRPVPADGGPQRPSPADATLQPAWHGAPPLREVPLGQRQRTEQRCGGCHRIEDRRPPPPLRGRAVMT